MCEYPMYLSRIIVDTVILREIGERIRTGAEIGPHIVQ